MGRYLDVAKKINNPSALTQEQGDLVYAEIEAALDNSETIVLDFSNVESMISPFLNNAIGQLYGKYTSQKIQECLELRASQGTFLGLWKKGLGAWLCILKQKDLP